MYGVDAPGDWVDKAACVEELRGLLDLGLSAVDAQQEIWAMFYPPWNAYQRGRLPKGTTVRKDPYVDARRVCAACPVAADCLAYAVAIGDYHGFRAGYTPDELEQLIRQRRLAG